MPITYDDIKYRLQPPLDCSEISDLRGRYFHNRLLTNYENTDFRGCVLFHCFPNGIPNAVEVKPAQSEEEVSLKGVSFEDADLLDADFSGADLRNSNFGYDGILISGANFRGADLEGSAFNGDLFNYSATESGSITILI